jgi:hypothetical protein
MNLTSTKNKEWKADCDAFRISGRIFELCDVKTEDHKNFVRDFCAQNKRKAERSERRSR